MPEVYAALGWDTGCYMTDWSDINAENWRYAVSEANKRDTFLSSVDDLQGVDDYEVTAEVPVGDYTFRLYKKKS